MTHAPCDTPLLVAELQYRHKRFLRDFNIAHRLHALLAFLLLFEELTLSRDISTVTLGNHTVTGIQRSCAALR